MSYSFTEPDWPAVCECKYDETRDEMDREDCPFHCDLGDNTAENEVRTNVRKRPAGTGDLKSRRRNRAATKWRALSRTETGA